MAAFHFPPKKRELLSNSLIKIFIPTQSTLCLSTPHVNIRARKRYLIVDNIEMDGNMI